VIGLFVILSAAAALDAGTASARPVALSADKLEYVGLENRAIYSGHARVVRDTTTLTCDLLTVQFSKNQQVESLTASGNVVAVDGTRTARGDQATYDNRTGVLVVVGRPEASDGAKHVRGESMTLTTGSEILTVSQATTVVDRVSLADAGTPIVIESELLTLENTKSTALWKGHVRAKTEQTLLTAPQVTATYDEHGTIKRVQAQGGVEVFEKDRWAKGQRADYDVGKGVLVVTGSPEARQGRNRTRGTKVVFYSGTDFVEVENATSVIEVEKSKSRK
jgi:lipopolysaccharide transport protein LptA